MFSLLSLLTTSGLLVSAQDHIARVTPTSNNGPFGLVRLSPTADDQVNISWDLTGDISAIGALHIHQVNLDRNVFIVLFLLFFHVMRFIEFIFIFLIFCFFNIIACMCASMVT